MLSVLAELAVQLLHQQALLALVCQAVDAPGAEGEESSTLGEHVAGVAMTVNVSCTGALPRLCLKVAWPQKNPP